MPGRIVVGRRGMLGGWGLGMFQRKETLERAGVLVEITGKKRDRSWAYQRYLDRLRVGTDLEVPTRR